MTLPLPVPADPVFAAQLESKKQRVTLDEMLDLARAEAARIEAVQRGLIAAGLRSRPDDGQIRNLVVFDTLAELVAFVQANEAAMRAIKDRRR